MSTEIERTATLTGTWRNPVLRLRFPVWATHPADEKVRLVAWVKSLPGRTFDAETSTWEVSGVGVKPEEKITRAGFTITGLGEGEFASITSLDSLYTPCSMLDSNRRHVLVRPRLAGYDTCLEMVGAGAVWVKKRGVFRVPVADVIANGAVRGGVLWDPAAIDAAFAAHRATPARAGLESAATVLGSAVNSTDVALQITQAAAQVGHYPSWFGVTPFSYQAPGALAVACGHTGLFDAPGVGKTLSFLLAAALTGAQRVLILCPPVVLTNWRREVTACGFAAGDEQIAVLAPGRKLPPLDGKKVVIVSDSLFTARAQIALDVVAWQPDIIGYDEAHRARSVGSKRSEAVLNMVAKLPGARRVAITGTPVMSSPHELVPILEFTGHLAPVFGGTAAFLMRYCRQDRYGKWHPRKNRLVELNAMLAEHVWVRRTKAQVLPQLPEATVTGRFLDVDLSLYRQTHTAVMDEVRGWVATQHETTGHLPTPDEVEEYAASSLKFVSQLRVAAGLCKQAVAVEMIRDHLADTGRNPDGTWVRPLLVWGHHIAVMDALRAALPEAGALVGGVNQKTRDTLVDDFQAGRIPVLICSITAAGVGLTLTRGSDALFVESDWTPALMMQAIDRQRRVGAKNAIGVQLLVAAGTLDEHIHHVLQEKGVTVSGILGDTDTALVTGVGVEAAITPAGIVEAMVNTVLGELVPAV